MRLVIGLNGLVVEAPMYIALARGYFQELGVEVETAPGVIGTQNVPQFASGDVDFAISALGPAIFNAIGRGVALEVQGPMSRMRPGFSSQYLIARRGLELGSYADLAGKRVAVISINSINDYLMELAARKGGIRPDSLELVPLPPADQVSALANGAIDVALASEPLVARAVDLGAATRWREMADFADDDQNTVMLASPHTATKAPDAARRFWTAWLKGAREYHTAFIRGNNPGPRAEVVRILIEGTMVKDPELYDKMSYGYLDPNAELNVASVQAQLDWWRARGQEAPPLDRLLNRKPAEEAVAALGRIEP